MKTNISNSRVNSGGKKLDIQKNFGRSTHDRSYIWRSSMSCGTLVPFMSELVTPGTDSEIKLEVDVKTLPTVGPLYGSMDIQLDVYQTPIRLYNAKMYTNRIDIGRNMQEVKFPLIELEHEYYHVNGEIDDNSQINPSCLLSYFGIRGLGRAVGEISPTTIKRKFTALKLLMYWDIVKNYYANKQEERGYYIHNDYTPNYLETFDQEFASAADGELGGIYFQQDNLNAYYVLDENWTANTYDLSVGYNFRMYYFDGNGDPDMDEPFISLDQGGNITTYLLKHFLTDINYERYEDEAGNKKVLMTGKYIFSAPAAKLKLAQDGVRSDVDETLVPLIKEFDLKQIDDMKDEILKKVGDVDHLVIDKDFSLDVYSDMLKYYLKDPEDTTSKKQWSKLSSQEGLALKTYNSDLFNNWLNSEWVDGSNGVTEVSSVAVYDGSFTIDALNMAKKVYYMMNRIAMSGGSLDDYLEATYDHKRAKAATSPVYHGSLIRNIVFQEVVSTAESSSDITQPLGTLAGKGTLGQKRIGGKFQIKTDEWSIIMGLVSITPNIDYSQGNKWDNNLLNMADIHKPDLDGIGYQDLITDAMHWADSEIRRDITGNYNTYMFSAGLQVSWQNYMTNVNETRGNFADKNKEMFMTLNRRYEAEHGEGIKDLTTYIDPEKFNHIFAYTNLDSQNYQVQIAVDYNMRAKMSAKQIPNL
jgi:hypothetical protein